MSTNPYMQSVSWRLPRSYIKAIKLLKKAGYSDTGSVTDIAALRKAIEGAWQVKFPDVPFPTNEETEA